MIDSLSGQSTGGSLSGSEAVAPQLLTPASRYGAPPVVIEADYTFPAPAFDPHAVQWLKSSQPDAFYAL